MLEWVDSGELVTWGLGKSPNYHCAMVLAGPCLVMRLGFFCRRSTQERKEEDWPRCPPVGSPTALTMWN